MTPDKFTELLGEIDSSYLEETDALRRKAFMENEAKPPLTNDLDRRRRQRRLRVLASAAGLVLVIGIGGRVFFTGGSSSSMSTGSGGYDTAASVDEDFADQEALGSDNASVIADDADESEWLQVRILSFTGDGFLAQITEAPGYSSMASGEEVLILWPDAEGNGLEMDMLLEITFTNYEAASAAADYSFIITADEINPIDTE